MRANTADSEEQAFDEDAPTTVMQETQLQALTERARVGSVASLLAAKDEPTVVARRSAAEIYAEADRAMESAPGAAQPAPVRHAQHRLRRFAVALILVSLATASGALMLRHWSRAPAAPIASLPLRK
jgi:hypothetical protein